MPAPMTTKESAIQRLKSNELLQAPILISVRRGERDLSVEHPTLSPSGAIIESAASALERGETHYADVPGIAPLREKSAAWLNRAFNAPAYEQENVLISAGIQEARFLTIQVLGDHLGGVALPEVVHPGARNAAGIRALDVSPIPVSPSSTMLPSVGAIRQALEGGAPLLYLESPSRLTGATYSGGEVEEIIALLDASDATVIWDQGLAPWVAPGDYRSIADGIESAGRVILIGELWPGMGLESSHIGYVAASPDTIEKLRVQKQVISICTNTAVQFAALEAAEAFERVNHDTREELLALKRQVTDQLGGSSLVLLDGSAASIIAVRCSDVAERARYLQDSGFAVADGSAFGAPDVLRLSILPHSDVLEAVTHLTSIVDGGATP